jgi:formylglycine-generating enzyme required for sulfatase activity
MPVTRSSAVVGTFLVLASTAVAQEASTPEQDAARAAVAAIEAAMVPISAGTFRMGDLSGRGMPDEKPVRQVTVDAFRLSKFEVTFEQFDAYAKAAGKPLPSDQGLSRGRYPAVHLNIADVQDFIDWLNTETGLSYRLPTEAEWEYAARAGSTSEYPWGATFDPAKANGSGTGAVDTWKFTSPVGSFPPNAWGLHDMIGNVWEWVQDCYVDSYEDAPLTAEARMLDVGECTPVIRGGSWANDPANLRVADRSWHAAHYRYYFLGFRLARDD